MTPWQFFDPSDSSVWVFPKNPNKMTSPFIQHSTATYPAANTRKFRAWRQPPAPFEWQFAGSTRTKDHYDTLIAWYVKDRLVHVTDHLSRTWAIQIVNLELTPQRLSRTVPWRYEYVVKTLMFGRIS